MLDLPQISRKHQSPVQPIAFMGINRPKGQGPCISYCAKPIAACIAATFMLATALSSPGAAQDNPTRDLYSLIAVMKAQNAELREQLDYQQKLLALFIVDPIAASAARQSYSDCEASAIKPYCAAFAIMYLPRSGTPAPRRAIEKE